MKKYLVITGFCIIFVKLENDNNKFNYTMKR